MAGITWQMTNSFSGRVDLRFFDETTGGVWPDSVNVYYIDSGQTLSYPLACTPGDQICYGATDDATGLRYWGVNIDNSKTCTACCYTCGQQTQPITL